VARNAVATLKGTEPPCRLVRFEAGDGVELSGLLYEPKRTSKHAVVFLHGTGGASVFSARRTNLLGGHFTAQDIAFFAFDNRGAHLVRRLKGRTRRSTSGLGGMAYERIRDCVHDLDGAIGELRRRGYVDITLAGHSTGANKIAVYDHYRPRNRAKRYVFLAGGDDTGMLHEQLGPRRFAAAILRARAQLAAGRGESLVPSTLSDLPMSWRSFLDMADPGGDYNVFPFLEALRGTRLSKRAPFRFLRGVRKPSLVLYGENDEYCYGDVSRCLAILAAALESRPNFELVMLSDADHGFSGCEEELASVIGGWIDG
jgi:pimeloyl-ACP methyl ester carboxylesterase